MPGERTGRRALTYLVLIPSYNTGDKLLNTVAEALLHARPVLVVIDGSTDGSGDALIATQCPDTALRVLVRPRNGGKGAAVFDGLEAAAAEGFTHVLVMDADGQHPAGSIQDFIEVSRRNPDAMILGQPVFDRDAPLLRVLGRRISNALAKLETRGEISDSLFGFRIYPLAPLLAVMRARQSMRGYDFDVEAVVRLTWRGVRAINLPAPVRYFDKRTGGISHFRYGRDNLLLARLHARLMAEGFARLGLRAVQWIRSSRH